MQISVPAMLCSTNITNLETLKESLFQLKYIIVLTILQCVFALATNTMLIIGLFKTNNPLPISHKLFIYLSFIDIFVNILNLVKKLMYMVETSCQTIDSLEYICALTILFGVLVFLNICLLRYWSIKEPLKQIPNRTFHIVIGLELAFVLIITFLIFYSIIAKEAELEKLFSYVLLIIVRIFAVGLLIVNSMSFRLLKRQPIAPVVTSTPNQLQSNQCDPPTFNQENIPDISSQQRIKQSRKAVITLFILIASNFLCTMPMLVVASLLNNLTSNSAIRFLLLNYLKLVWMMNTGINSIIYMVRTKNLRLYFALLFGRIRQQVVLLASIVSIFL